MSNQRPMRRAVAAGPGRRRSRTALGVAVAGITLLAACTSDGGGGATADGGSAGPSGTRPAGDWPEASFASALEPYDSCDDLAGRLQDAALDRVGPYGLEDGYRGGIEGDVVFEDVGMAVDEAPVAGGPATTTASRAAADDGSGGGDTSGTNVQVAGVDEPDLVKVDGDLVYSTVDGRLLVIDLSGDVPVLLGAVDLPSYDQQLLVDGDRVLAISSGWGGPIPLDEVGISAEEADDLAPGTPTVELTTIDVSDPASPTVVGHQSVDGSLVGARMVDGTARLVTTASPAGFDFVYPSGRGSQDVAEATNRAILEDSSAEDWLPQVRSVDDDGTITAAEAAVTCEAVSHPGVWSGPGTVSVLTVDVDGGGIDPSATVSVQASGETVYASTDTLYVATWEHLDGDLADDPEQARGDDLVTAIHAFDISGAAPATYLATGEVPGDLLDQFAMDEHDGTLRVATTVGTRFGGEASESFVTTLRRDGADLAQVGQVGEMGRTEQIRSVRFLGDVGYVVTFRQTDPLYTVDLADPAAPTVVGELKIPGFSSYLHPVGDGRLVGIGQDATDEGRTTGTQVSLFDVSDPSSPQRIQQWQVPDGTSMAEGDHHAFLWWAPEDLLVIPLSSYGDVLLDGGSLSYFDGAVALDVGDDGIRERGRVQHLVEDIRFEDPYRCGPNERCIEPVPELELECGPEDDCVVAVEEEPTTTTICGVAGCDPIPTEPVPVPTTYPSPIERTLVVNGNLVTISDQGVMVSTLADLTQLGWLTTGY